MIVGASSPAPLNSTRDDMVTADSAGIVRPEDGVVLPTVVKGAQIGSHSSPKIVESPSRKYISPD